VSVVNAGVAQLVERNLAKVEVESSRLFSRSKILKGSLPKLPFLFRKDWSMHWLLIFVKIDEVHAGVAQLVERNLAKVEVESSRLFSRSKF
jgi:hypothetical protein